MERLLVPISSDQLRSSSLGYYVPDGTLICNVQTINSRHVDQNANHQKSCMSVHFYTGTRFWGVKYNCAPFCKTKTHNQFLHNFLHNRKLNLDVTSCDLLDFWLWQDVICWAPSQFFILSRNVTYLDTATTSELVMVMDFSLQRLHSRLANFHHSEYSFPPKRDFRVILIFFCACRTPGARQVCARCARLQKNVRPLLSLLEWF